MNSSTTQAKDLRLNGNLQYVVYVEHRPTRTQVFYCYVLRVEEMVPAFEVDSLPSSPKIGDKVGWRVPDDSHNRVTPLIELDLLSKVSGPQCDADDDLRELDSHCRPGGNQQTIGAGLCFMVVVKEEDAEGLLEAGARQQVGEGAGLGTSVTRHGQVLRRAYRIPKISPKSGASGTFKWHTHSTGSPKFPLTISPLPQVSLSWLRIVSLI